MKTKTKVPVASDNLNYFPMKKPVATTDQFFRPSVPYCFKVVAGSKAEIDVSAFRRVNPMVLPILSIINFNTRFYYVPMIDICPYYKELKEQTPYAFRYSDAEDPSSVIPTSTPTVDSATIFRLFLNQFTQNTGGASPYWEDWNENNASMFYYSAIGTIIPFWGNWKVKYNGDDRKALYDYIEKNSWDSVLDDGTYKLYNPYLQCIYDNIFAFVDGEYQSFPLNTDEEAKIEVVYTLVNDRSSSTEENLNNNFKSLLSILDIYLKYDIKGLLDGFDSIQNDDLIDSFTVAGQTCLGYDESTEASNSYLSRYEHEGEYDFVFYSDMWYNGAATQCSILQFRNLTERGRIAYKLFKLLGYDFCVLNDKDHYVEYDAMKLLAFVKVILDYYENSAFINNTTRLAKLQSLLHIDVDHYKLTVDDLDLIVDLACYMTYERDYFTTNFVNPIAGNNFVVNDQDIIVNDPTTGGVNVIKTDDAVKGTPVLSTEAYGLSSTGISLLKRLTNYLKRYQIAGGRWVDRMLAEFGITGDNSYDRRTSYIDTVNSVLSIQEIFNTTSDQLADYAGYGTTGVQNNIITINAPHEDGIIIAIDTISPEIMYSQGYNRQNRMNTPFKMYRPDFDGVSPQLTEQGEVLMIKDCRYHYGIGTDNWFIPADKRSLGYTDYYMQLKTDYGIVAGDFICNSVNRDKVGMLTDRKFNPVDYATDRRVNITQSVVFSAAYDQQQYNRIFYYDGDQSMRGTTDYINSFFRFDIKLWSPMKTPFDSYEFDSNNKEVNLELTGTTMT